MICSRIVILALCFWTMSVFANMQDPTKPPLKTAPKKTIESEVLRLKMVKMDKINGKHTANINGVVVRVGGIYADAKVIKIEFNSVELKGPDRKSVV